MKLILAISFALLACVQARETGIRSFNGYKVLSVHATTPEQFYVLKSLYQEGTMDFWTSPILNGLTDIMVSPVEAERVVEIAVKNGMTFTVKVEDVQKLVAEERALNREGATGRMDWTSYPRWAELEPWIQGLDASAVATVINIGQTYEKRNMYAVKISSGGAPKTSVLIDANIHAREWIAGATATWILNELTTNSSAYTTLLQDLDIYIIPFINIDGYEYCHTADRMWRKTRSVEAGVTCRGCDPNRNFAFKWGGESTSDSPCSDLYTGLAPFSESETQAVRDFVLESEASGVKFSAYLTFHSYGPVWLLPWGYTQGVYPPDYAEQLDVGTRAIEALQKVHGTKYDVGQGADQLYGVGGASDDWAKDHGIKYTATIEMRGSPGGFILPPSQIIPNAEEIWAGLQVYFAQVISEN